MKRMIVMGVLMAIATGCTPKPDATPEPPVTPEPTTATPEPIQEPESTPDSTPTVSESVPEPQASAPVPQAPTTYVADTYGFSFSYPDRYFMPEQNYIDYSSDQSGTLQKTVELWQQQDYDDIQQRLKEITELPPNIIVQVFENPDQRPLTDWKPELSSPDVQPLQVGGQEAIAFSSTGLYEHDNVVVSTPDGKYVLRLSVGYFDANDPMRQDFQDMVSSLTFQ